MPISRVEFFRIVFFLRINLFVSSCRLNSGSVGYGTDCFRAPPCQKSRCWRHSVIWSRLIRACRNVWHWLTALIPFLCKVHRLARSFNLFICIWFLLHNHAICQSSLKNLFVSSPVLCNRIRSVRRHVQRDRHGRTHQAPKPQLPLLFKLVSQDPDPCPRRPEGHVSPSHSIVNSESVLFLFFFFASVFKL